jgi:hypothetical protein
MTTRTSFILIVVTVLAYELDVIPFSFIANAIGGPGDARTR